jgi:hypothetical protein
VNLDWRPPGWASDPAVAVAAVAQRGLEARAKQKRREVLTLADEAALADLALLRQCYCTPRWVWRLAGWLLGVEPGEWQGDPFHNEWSHARAFLAPDAWTMDGLDGPHGPDPNRDGFVTWHDLVEAAGAPECDIDEPGGWTEQDPAWPGRGPLLVNGPHRKGPQGLAGWVPLAARAGRLRKVAAVVPSDAVGWFVEHGMRCDAEVSLGRMDYDLVPGLPPITGNERCSSLLLWDPDKRREARETGDEIQPCMIEVRDDRGRLLRLPLRPGLGDDPHVVEVTWDDERSSGSSA